MHCICARMVRFQLCACDASLMCVRPIYESWIHLLRTHALARWAGHVRLHEFSQDSALVSRAPAMPAQACGMPSSRRQHVSWEVYRLTVALWRRRAGHSAAAGGVPRGRPAGVRGLHAGRDAAQGRRRPRLLHVPGHRGLRLRPAPGGPDLLKPETAWNEAIGMRQEPLAILGVDSTRRRHSAELVAHPTVWYIPHFPPGS